MHQITGKITGKSTAILPDAACRNAGQSTGMKLGQILQRIEQRLRTLKISADKVSRLAGKPDAIRNIRRAVKEGRAGVNATTIAALAPILQTSQAWLLSGEGPVNQQPKKELRNLNLSSNLIDEDMDIDSDDLANVPEMDIYGGGGLAGGFNQEENISDGLGNSFSRDVVRAHWGIPTPFLRGELNTSPGRANIIPVRGDSMNDALFAGDRAIINLDDTDVGQDGIFALLDDSASLIIKQVEVVRGSRAHRIVCTSRNPAYKPFELELTHPVRIVGRVVGKITRL
jgi:hypothetical protein